MYTREGLMRSATQGWRRAGVVVAALLAVSSGAAGGTTSLSFVSTQVGSHGSMGTYSGSMTWSWMSGDSGTLTVSLTNTSHPDNVGGFLTAIAFGGPVGAPWGYSLTSAPSGFGLLGGTSPADVDADPFGTYSVGASTTGSWLGGGQPAGLAPGQTGTFVFTVEASSGLLAALTAGDFWGDPIDPSQGIGSWGFVARFRGIGPNGEDSDKSPAMQSLVVVPIPAPALLAGLGLIGVVAARRRFTRN